MISAKVLANTGFAIIQRLVLKIIAKTRKATFILISKATNNPFFTLLIRKAGTPFVIEKLY